MFVGLAHCQINYKKEAEVKNSKFSETQSQIGYWLLLDFVEFINFENYKPSWIKLEFVMKGKKHSSDKIHLHQFSVNSLNRAFICMHLCSEDF